MKNSEQLKILEQTIINACLNGQMQTVLAQAFNPMTFTNASYQLIFKIMFQLESSDQQIDLPTIGSMLAGNQKALCLLTEAYDQGASTLNLDYALRIVKNASQTRALLSRIKVLYTEALETDISANYDLTMKLAALIDDQKISSKTEHADEGLTLKAIESIESDIENGIRSIRTGIKKLDFHLGGGMKPGKLITIAARPGCGKTALTTNIALTAAKKGFRSLYITIELDALEIMERHFCTEVGINATAMSSRDFTEDTLDDLCKAAKQISRLPLSVNSTTQGSWENAEIAINVACQLKKTELVIIDYIQQFHVTSAKMSPREELNYMTSRCKHLAMKHRVPIIIVAQLNRDIEKRTEKVPLLSDLKESGSIEQDSDAVLLLYDKVIEEENDELWIRIAKNRQGACGCFKLKADLAINKFYADCDSV